MKRKMYWFYNNIIFLCVCTQFRIENVLKSSNLREVNCRKLDENYKMKK